MPKGCFFLPDHIPCYVQLGKHGDLMILLVGLKKIFDETGIKPVVLSSHDYGITLEGASYIERWLEPLDWLRDLRRAQMMAEHRYGWCVVPKWWDNPAHLPPPPINGETVTTLRFGGNIMQIPASEWDSYQLSQWRAAGFRTQEMIDWPLVFDNRNAQRENDLMRRVFRNQKKKLLLNLAGGGSSPFGNDPEVLQVIRRFSNDFEIVNLQQVAASRIYDLLGIFERSAGMVTVDTATLHLAGACSIPYVAYIANGGGGSIPKGNCVAAIRYGDTHKRIKELEEQIASWL
jgi:hypothetical protein